MHQPRPQLGVWPVRIWFGHRQAHPLAIHWRGMESVAPAVEIPKIFRGPRNWGYGKRSWRMHRPTDPGTGALQTL